MSEQQNLKPIRDWTFEDFRGYSTLALGYLRGMQAKYEDNKDINESLERLIKITRMEEFFIDGQEEEKKFRKQLHDNPR